MLYRIIRKIRKELIKRSRDPRSSSYPFISGDTFRSIANHIYENGRENPDRKSYSFDPKSVKEGDVVFVQTDVLDEYFSKVHPYIQNSYKLITHNSDRNITEKELGFIDGKIIRWFAQNVLVEHPKITPIPIGLENAHYANAGLFKFFKSKKTPKGPYSDKIWINISRSRNGRIYVNFNTATNPTERIPCLEAIKKSPLVDIVDWKSQHTYVADVKKYSAVVSPPGNGADCHRTWEALYLGAVPIVKDSAFIRYFKSLGIPLCVISDWNDIPTEFIYDTSDCIYFDYWKKKIGDAKI